MVMKFVCHSCQKEIDLLNTKICNGNKSITCTCGARYAVDIANSKFERIANLPLTPSEPVTSFYRPHELSEEMCTQNLLQALSDQRNSGRMVEFWKHRLRWIRRTGDDSQENT